MADEKQIQQAQTIYEKLCRVLDGYDWQYEKNDETRSIKCGFRGEDIPIELNIEVDVERTLVLVISCMSYTIQEDKRLDLAIAISAVNSTLVDCCFDYDISKGNIFFRMANTFLDRELSETLLAYMLVVSCHHIDSFNDKFLMISKGMLSIEQFLSDLENN